jgi:hypothetical protein
VQHIINYCIVLNQYIIFIKLSVIYVISDAISMVLNDTNNVQICYVIAPNFPLHSIYPRQMDFDLPDIRIETTNRNRELVISA